LLRGVDQRAVRRRGTSAGTHPVGVDHSLFVELTFSTCTPSTADPGVDVADCEALELPQGTFAHATCPAWPHWPSRGSLSWPPQEASP
jgi:hypothetical protein